MIPPEKPKKEKNSQKESKADPLRQEDETMDKCWPKKDCGIENALIAEQIEKI